MSKHYLLVEMCRRLGFKAVYAPFPSLLNNPDLQYPPKLRQLATGLPVAHHLGLSRLYQRPVGAGGCALGPFPESGRFPPVNEHWDERADTSCTIKPLRSAVRTAFCRMATNELCRDSRERDLNPLDGEQDHVRYYHGKTGIRSADEIERIRRFYQEFDAWLREIREP